ncbi:unnamed protein product [Ectocarpus sp. 12 AP-2014]
MGLFKYNKQKKNNTGEVSLLEMMEDLKTQQAVVAETLNDRDRESELRITSVLSGLEQCMAQLETLVRRLDNVTETLVEEIDAQAKPWYVRIFCP